MPNRQQQWLASLALKPPIVVTPWVRHQTPKAWRCGSGFSRPCGPRRRQKLRGTCWSSRSDGSPWGPQVILLRVGAESPRPKPKTLENPKNCCCCGVQERLRKKLLWSLQVAKAAGSPVFLLQSFKKKLFFCVWQGKRDRIEKKAPCAVTEKNELAPYGCRDLILMYSNGSRHACLQFVYRGQIERFRKALVATDPPAGEARAVF